jgi:GMP synthase (glutamine-hydrolysing)
MNTLIIKHIDVEGPGLIEYCLKQNKIPYQTLCLGTDVRLPKPDGFTHVVILGGPMNVYEEDRYPFLRDEDLFIKEVVQRGKSILGICLGAQLIAKALGAKVTKAPSKEIGWYDVSLTKEGTGDPLFHSLPKTFPVFQWHEDTFEVPKGGRLIATSAAVPNQAFRYGDNAYGIQFHLEVTEGMIEEWMETYEEEIRTSQPVHFSKSEIRIETEITIETHTKRGITFLNNFFKQAFLPKELIETPRFKESRV